MPLALRPTRRPLPSCKEFKSKFGIFRRADKISPLTYHSHIFHERVTFNHPDPGMEPTQLKVSRQVAPHTLPADLARNATRRRRHALHSFARSESTGPCGNPSPHSNSSESVSIDGFELYPRGSVVGDPGVAGAHLTSRHHTPGGCTYRRARARCVGPARVSE